MVPLIMNLRHMTYVKCRKLFVLLNLRTYKILVVVMLKKKRLNSTPVYEDDQL